jgi:hypothetical protein
MTCETCKYWSETCAQSIGGGPMEAMCENERSPKKGRMMTETDSCQMWTANARAEDHEVYPPARGSEVL